MKEKITAEQIGQMERIAESEMSYKQIAEELGLHRATVAYYASGEYLRRIKLKGKRSHEEEPLKPKPAPFVPGCKHPDCKYWRQVGATLGYGCHYAHDNGKMRPYPATECPGM